MKKNSDTYIPPTEWPVDPTKQQADPSLADRLSDKTFDSLREAKPEDHKTSVKSLQFDLKSKESRKIFVGLVDELHQQSVLFSLRQDVNLVWLEL